MLTKLKQNNKGGADLQFAIAVFLFMFVVCLALLIDFWFVSSAKISILKTTQQSELFALVKSVPSKNELGGNDASGNYENIYTTNLCSIQNTAVGKTGPELEERLETFTFINDYDIISIHGLQDCVGQIGVTTQMQYRVKTMLRSPEQIFSFMNGAKEDDLDAKKWVPLTVTTKMIPIITDKNIGE